jgi:small acid-soluble spore protein H (minor)
MDKKRAKEIAASSIMAQVTYKGTPVYIENVNETNGTAYIRNLHQPDYKQEVLLTNLIEH